MRRPLRLLNLLMMVLLAVSVVACEKKEDDDDDDDDNNINQSPSVSSVTRNNAFTVVGLGGAINLSASASDPDGDNLTYSWEVTTTGASPSDGGSPLVTYSGQNVSHTAAGSGVQTATVTVSDGRGGSATGSVTFVTSDINGQWEFRVPGNPICGNTFFIATFTRTGNTFSGTTITPDGFCAAPPGSVGNTDPAVPATINAQGQITIRWKLAFFSDFIFTGQIDTNNGRIINGNVTQSGFAGENSTLTKR
jgi:hypothetical protein